MSGDKRMRAERQWLIPAEVVQASLHSPHLYAAVTRYVESGDATVWSVCLDALRAECERLTAECERLGMEGMALPIGPWPEGTSLRGDALTTRQATALVHAAEAYRLLLGAAVRRRETETAPLAVAVDRK